MCFGDKVPLVLVVLVLLVTEVKERDAKWCSDWDCTLGMLTRSCWLSHVESVQSKIYGSADIVYVGCLGTLSLREE